MSFTKEDVSQALRFLDWSALLNAEDGTSVPFRLHGEFASATKVSSVDKEDEDYDRDLTIVIEVDGRYFRKTGWSNVGSHCYGESEPSWNAGLTEVKPVSKTVTEYETV